MSASGYFGLVRDRLAALSGKDLNVDERDGLVDPDACQRCPDFREDHVDGRCVECDVAGEECPVTPFTPPDPDDDPVWITGLDWWESGDSGMYFRRKDAEFFIEAPHAIAALLPYVEVIEALPPNCVISRSDGRWRIYTGTGAGAGEGFITAAKRAGVIE